MDIQFSRDLLGRFASGDHAQNPPFRRSEIVDCRPPLPQTIPKNRSERIPSELLLLNVTKRTPSKRTKPS
jgi:hypothetical protein